MSSDDCIEVFAELGFSRLEAEIYVYLIQASPATGYRVAKGIGRSKTNTYKALASLEAKRAILVEKGGRRRCRAVPPDELVRQIENGFRERRNRALRAVRSLSGGRNGKQRPLASVDDVVERCRAMLDAARRVVYIDAFPGPLALLQPEIEATIGRGVEVCVIAYQPISLPGGKVGLRSDASSVRGQLQGDWIAMAVDGEQHLHAALGFNGRDVQEATWSAGPIFGQMHLGYLRTLFQLTTPDRPQQRGAPYWRADPVRIGNQRLERPPVCPAGEREV